MTRAQSILLSLVIAFGMGVLVTLWGLEADYRDAAMALDKLGCTGTPTLHAVPPIAAQAKS